MKVVAVSYADSTFKKNFNYMQTPRIILSLSLLLLFAACTKQPGTGGRASIKGRVYARNYNNSFILIDSGYLGAQKVYIKYGDQPGVGGNTDTDYDGVFDFPYLRPGKYTVYTYSKTLVNGSLDSAVIQTVTIKDRKEVVEVPQLNIITLKN